MEVDSSSEEESGGSSVGLLNESYDMDIPNMNISFDSSQDMKS